MKELSLRHFVKTVMITSIWIHISEVLRYFLFVIPKTKAYFPERMDVAEMNIWIFAIWGLWDMLLTIMVVISCWACLQLFGHNRKSIGIASLFSWTFFFVLFWVGAANMGFTSWNTLCVTLPLSAIEMWIACYITLKLFRRETLKEIRL